MVDEPAPVEISATAEPDRSRLRCPYCHDDLQADSKTSVCDLCWTEHHTDCFRDGCVVFGCEGAPNARAPLTAFRVVLWGLLLSIGAIVGTLPGTMMLGGSYALLGKCVGALVMVVAVGWILRKTELANARATVAMAAAKRLHGSDSRTHTAHTEEGLAIITLGGIGGGSGVDATLAKLAANAPPPTRPSVAEAAELPDACPECGVAIEEPEGKEEPDWFCYHCGGQLIQRGKETA